MPRRQLTHSITLGDIPVVTINAHEYREFRLEPENEKDNGTSRRPAGRGISDPI